MINYSRNYIFIDDELQKKMADTKILICGAGIGGVFAELALRTGFRNLTIADGDEVSDSNLNRQNYTARDVGSMKTSAIDSRLRKIDPSMELAIESKFLGSDDLKRLIPNSDFVINTIDFDSPVFLECGKLCRRFSAVEIFPINLGFGSAAAIFDQDSETWASQKLADDPIQLKREILEGLLRTHALPPYLVDAAKEYFDASSQRGYDPQLGVSSVISAALIVSLMLRTLRGEPGLCFPRFHFLDPMTAQPLLFQGQV